MTEKFVDVLDDALEAMKTEPVTAVLHRYPNHAKTLAPLLTAAEKLRTWQTVTSPTPAADWQTADRAVFLAQMEQLPAAAVSPGPLLRLKGWLVQKRTAFHKRQLQKEQKTMNAIFARAVATALVIFGLGGGTIALANDSLPDTPLYPVKLMLEETRMALADNPVEQANLQMTLAQVRLEEMTQFALTGDSIGEPHLAQLETHLQTALQLAAQTGDPELIGLLTQMQTMLQNEQQTIAQLGEPAQTRFGEVNQVLHRYQEQVQAGLADPPKFRWRHAGDEGWEPPGSGQQNGQDAGPNGTGQNGSGNGVCQGNCEPVGDQNQFGQDHENSNAPDHAGGSNGPNGPSDDACVNSEDCVPVGGANQHGQDVDNSGQNGDGVCQNNCTPGSGHNQHGQNDDSSGQNGGGSQPNPDNGNGSGNNGNGGGQGNGN